MAAYMTQVPGAPSPVGMVVDDDALVRESVAEVLEDLCDHVYRASDGLEGLEMLRLHPDISVIVTDIAMPRLDGIAFATRARHLHPDLKVLFVSGMQRPPLQRTIPAQAVSGARIGLGAAPPAGRAVAAYGAGMTLSIVASSAVRLNGF